MRHLAVALLFVNWSKIYSLVCYTCGSESGNSSCVVNPQSHKWQLCEGQCQVWRLYSEVDSSVYMFERSCNTLCREGCTFLSDMEHRFVGCSSCCETDFCNTGNSSDRLPSKSPFIIVFFYLCKVYF